MSAQPIQSSPSAIEAGGQATQDVAELIEEVSIDGMCGVY
jgi:mycofactocin precursor